MTPCISQVTTLRTPFEADIPAYARVGWPAVELWLTKLETFLEAHPLAEGCRAFGGFGDAHTVTACLLPRLVAHT